MSAAPHELAALAGVRPIGEGIEDIEDDNFENALEVLRELTPARPRLPAAWATIRAAALHHDRVPTEDELGIVEAFLGGGAYPQPHRAEANALLELLEDVLEAREHSSALERADDLLGDASPEDIAADPILGALAALESLVCEAPAASPDFPDVKGRALAALRGAR